MIAMLNGQIAFKSVDHIILDVGGVGYRLVIPLSTFYSLPESGPARLHVHTQVREDAIVLFGFLTTAEKEMFSLLLQVSGIGPKLAVNILSHIATNDLKGALAAGDVQRLSGLPGIGKKTAERLVLELREKVRDTELEIGSDPSGPVTVRSDALDDAVSALVNLGYKASQARKILENMEVAPGTTVEEVLKGALKILVK